MTYTPTVVNGSAHTIKASYGGSATHATSTDATGFTLVVSSVTVTPGTQQYSDRVTFVAVVSPDSAPATSVTFKVGTQTVGTAVLVAGGGVLTGTLSDLQLVEPSPFGTAPTGQMAPGAHTVTADFRSGASDSTVADATTKLTIQQEDARASYTGALFSSTSSTSSSSATVTLSATVQDITAVTSDPAYDPNAGDIRNATVKFVNRDGGNAVLCTAPVGLVSLGDTNTGTATCNWSANLGSSDSQQVTVGIVVGNYYTRDSSADDTVVTVSKPLTSNFITGGGYLVMSSSGGQTPGASGSKMNYGFNVKYNKGGTNLQGNINIIVRNGGRTYQIKGNSMTSLAASPATCPNATSSSPCTATFNGKANIQDITNPTNPVSIDGNGTLQVTLTDKGEPGSSDTIGVTLWNKSGGLWFSSNWNGTRTVEQVLGGGNLVVH